jgi:hypothetical protein
VEMSEGDGGGDDGEKPVAPTSPPNVVSKAVRMIRLRKPRPESLTLSTVSGCVGACVCVCVCVCVVCGLLSSTPSPWPLPSSFHTPARQRHTLTRWCTHGHFYSGISPVPLLPPSALQAYPIH